jgi:hypothetical protein
MTSRVEYLLKEWGRWYEKNVDWADMWGINILYRAGFMTGRSGRPGHKILCPDASPIIRRVDVAVSRLPEDQGAAVKLRYCSPLREDGKHYTNKQLAEAMGVSESKYKRLLSKARQCLRKILDQ